MNDWHNDPDRASIENIVRQLKKPMHLDESFELRVMSAVHAEALAKIDAAHAPANDHWWSKRYTLRFTALGGLAAAASIMAVIALTSIMSRNPQSAVRQQSALSNPVHFVLVNDQASQVFIVGDFNNWQKTKLVKAANESAWTVALPLPAGKHEYAFIVDDANGEHWVADPLSSKVEDEFGTESSIVRVGPASS